LEKEVKRELGIIYISSDGRTFLKEMDARYAQMELNRGIVTNHKKKETVMKIAEIIMMVLKENNWGVYYKSQPMHPLEMQDGNALYKVNQVDESDVESKVIKKLEETSWIHSQTNLNQKKT
tara:strand:- start:12317 stop:12679 length:363 start_codon:yes stop_codon:yes gene_type:complete